jgi:hypothetical protein
MKGLRPSLLSAGKLKKLSTLKVDNFATKHRSPLRKVSDFEDVMKGLRPSLLPAGKLKSCQLFKS